MLRFSAGLRARACRLLRACAGPLLWAGWFAPHAIFVLYTILDSSLQLSFMGARLSESNLVGGAEQQGHVHTHTHISTPSPPREPLAGFPGAGSQGRSYV